MSGPYGRCDLVGVGVLEQVAGRTGLDRRLHALLLGERGQRHDLHVVVASPDLTGRLDAVEGLHLKVHQDHVGSPPLGVQPGEQVERMRSPVGIADDLEVGFAVEEGQQPAAHDRVIVDHQHADPSSAQAPPRPLPVTGLHPDDGAQSGRARDRQEPADLGRTAAHRLETEVTWVGCGRVEATAVVADLDEHAPRSSLDAEPTPWSRRRA